MIILKVQWNITKTDIISEIKKKLSPLTREYYFLLDFSLCTNHSVQSVQLSALDHVRLKEIPLFCLTLFLLQISQAQQQLLLLEYFNINVIKIRQKKRENGVRILRCKICSLITAMEYSVTSEVPLLR